MADTTGAAPQPEPIRQTREKAASAPDPEDPRKPKSPTDIHRPTWGYVIKRATAEFSKDQATDLAAGLTYFAVLSLFPLLLALVSLLGVFGQGEQTAQALKGWVDSYAPEGLSQLLGQTISGLASQSGAGWALATGLAGALWAASGYVGALSRAMNRIYEVQEGRPFWKLKPEQLLITAAIVVILALVVAALILSGPVAQWVGALIGVGDYAVLLWNILKWPFVVALVLLAVALLYYFTPNVRQPRFRWISVGALVSLLVSALAVAGFSFYVSNFSSYNATYGVIGSVIVLLLGLWIINTVLLLGAEIDAELERGRQLQGGIEAEATIKLQPRDTRAVEKLAQRQTELVEHGRQMRRRAEERIRKR